MIPHMTRGGRSFKGAFMYYMHDKEANSRDRVAWTHTENMLTRDPDKAWKVMAYTAMNQDRLKEASGHPPTGRKMQKPVMAFSLSWHPDLKPDRDHMLETALDAVQKLGLREHEILVVAHSDTKHPHVHIMVNRIHPISGLAASDAFTHRHLSEFAAAYEKKLGLELCPQRKKNEEKRKKGEVSKYRNSKIQAAWDRSTDGSSLKRELQREGFLLAQGRKRIVVIDPKGKEINPVRHIEGIKTKDFMQRLGDLAQGLPTPQQIKDAKSKRDMASDIDLAFDSATEQDNQPTPEQKPEAIEPSLAAKNAHEIRALAERQEREMRTVKRNLQSHYRLREQVTDLKALKAKCDHAPWWKKMLGITKRDRDKLRTAHTIYKDSKRLYDEQIMRTEQRHKAQAAKLIETQQKRIDKGMDQSLAPRRSMDASYAVKPSLSM